MSIENLRNIAIIAHVDHGKTTLVDKLLSQSGTLDRKDADAERLMDSNDQEKERGITILAKNTAIKWNDYRINIVDTPGHADFGGEVERVLSMVDSVLLLVDAVDGPMPQTRFVTSKAFEQGLRPIVVINKVDRPGARPDWVMDQVFDLFDSLGATDEQLDFPVIYASALNGIAGTDVDNMAEDMTPLYEMIVADVPSPQVDVNGPFQMQISALAYDSYVGVIGVGRITRGKLKPNQQVIVKSSDGKERKGKKRRGKRTWDKRDYKSYDDNVELGTRGMKISLRRLRKLARTGAEDEFDINNTIDKTAKNGGMLDIVMRSCIDSAFTASPQNSIA